MKSVNRFHSIERGEIEIAERAYQYKDAFGIASQLYVNIIDVLEFKVRDFIPDFRLMVRRDIELNVTAETTIDPPRIYVRETIYDSACEGDTDCRRILAHELGHLLLHWKIAGPMQKDGSGYRPQFSNLSLLESCEDQADVFARNFLIPPHIAFANRTDVERLARLTGTSKQVASAAITISKRQEMLKIRDPKH